MLMRYPIVLSAALLLLLNAGCTVDSTPPSTCTTDDECESGFVCEDAACVASEPTDTSEDVAEDTVDDATTDTADDTTTDTFEDPSTDTSPVCGDGVIHDGEACDDGNDNSNSVADACRTNCEHAWCGDGVVDTGELCDPASLDDGPPCTDDCTWFEEPICESCGVDEECWDIYGSPEWMCLAGVCVQPELSHCDDDIDCTGAERCAETFAGRLCLDTSCAECIGTECGELCHNDVDDNLDGWIDCDDPTCDAECGTGACAWCETNAECAPGQVCDGGLCRTHCGESTDCWSEASPDAWCDPAFGLCVDPTCTPPAECLFCEGGCPPGAFCEAGICQRECMSNAECHELAPNAFCDIPSALCVQPSCPDVVEAEDCYNGWDDDGDSLIDCNDDDCRTMEHCAGCPSIELGCRAYALTPFISTVTASVPVRVECRTIVHDPAGGPEMRLEWALEHGSTRESDVTDDRARTFMLQDAEPHTISVQLIESDGMACSPARVDVEMFEAARDRIELTWGAANGSSSGTGFDMDLHVRRAGTPWGADNDCFSSNLTTEWGGSLNQDHTMGPGPEIVYLDTDSDLNVGVHVYGGPSGSRTTAHIRVYAGGRVHDTEQTLGLGTAGETQSFWYAGTADPRNNVFDTTGAEVYPSIDVAGP